MQVAYDVWREVMYCVGVFVTCNVGGMALRWGCERVSGLITPREDETPEGTSVKAANDLNAVISGFSKGLESIVESMGTVVTVSGSRQNVWSKKTWQASPEELEARKNLHKEIVKLNPENLRKIKEGLEKYSAYLYNNDETIVVTDDWTDRENVHIPGQYKPYAVIDTVSQRGTQRDRTFFDANGWQVRQISNGPHGNPKRHDYGENGEHAHDITWKENNTQRRETRNLTDAERKENADIL